MYTGALVIHIFPSKGLLPDKGNIILLAGVLQGMSLTFEMFVVIAIMRYERKAEANAEHFKQINISLVSLSAWAFRALFKRLCN